MWYLGKRSRNDECASETHGGPERGDEGRKERGAAENAKKCVKDGLEIEEPLGPPDQDRQDVNLNNRSPQALTKVDHDNSQERTARAPQERHAIP